MTDEQIKDWENCVQVAKVRSPNAWVAVDAGTVLAVESALRAAVPDDVIDSLNFVDDFIARCNGDDRGSCESVNIIRRWLEASPQAPQAAQPVQPSEQVRKPLSDAEIAEMILQEQFLLVVDDEESFTEIVRAVERAHNIREK